MKYEWLLLDLDNTILDFDQAMSFGFEKTIHDYGIPFEKDHYAIYQKINHECWADLEKGKITQDELRTLRMERFLKYIESHENPIHFSSTYHQNLSEKIFWMDNAEDLVKGWSNQFNLALVTNGLKEIQRARLEKSGLENYFQEIIISDEIGVAKPHHGFFDHVFEKIKYPKKDKVMIVGDSLGSDIRGGNDFGIDTCWINLKGKNIPEDNQPTYVIGRLDELNGVL